MIKILLVSIIIMLYEYGLKKSVSILQKRNYAPKEIKTLFPWSGGPRSSGVGFFCFVSLRA